MIELPHPQTHREILDFCRPEFLGQVKMDGTRLAIVYGDDCVPEFGVTKNGLKVVAPELQLPKMAPGTVLDGELLGAGTWQSSQSSLRALFLGERVECSWAAFDLLEDPLGVTELPGFEHRTGFLKARGFPLVPTGEVEAMWQLVAEHGLEGVVVRRRTADSFDASWKVKRGQEINAIVHRNKAFVLTRSGTPHLVASIPKQDGLYRLACEGKTSGGKLRAARVVGPPVGGDFSYGQLAALRE